MQELRISFDFKDRGNYVESNDADKVSYFSVETLNDGSALVTFRCYDLNKDEFSSIKKVVKPNSIECFFPELLRV